MTQCAPTVIFEDMLEALEDEQATTYLNKRTGEIARLYDADRWKEDATAEDAREDIERRPADWLLLPHTDAEHTIGLAEWLIKNGVHPTLV